jgi:hypothetical protein
VYETDEHREVPAGLRHSAPTKVSPPILKGNTFLVTEGHPLASSAVSERGKSNIKFLTPGKLNGLAHPIFRKNPGGA